MDLVVAAVILAVAALWTSAVWAAARYGDRRVIARRTVMVNLRSGGAVEGVVTQHGPELLLLADAILHDPDVSNPIKAAGDVVVYRSNITFIQRREAVTK